MTTLIQDLKFGLHMLVKNPGFTAVAVLSIGLGISANTSVFSVLNAVRFRPLPFEDPGRLVMMEEVNPVQGARRPPTFGTFQAWKAQSHSFESMGITGAPSDSTYHGPDGAERIPIDGFDVGFQSVLNIKPILGRRLTEEDQTVGFYGDAVLISYDFWQKLGGKPDIVGRKLAMEDRLETVAGVLPQGFWIFPWAKNTQLWAGFDFRKMPQIRFMDKIARLKAGISIQQAEAELAIISGRSKDTHTDIDQGWVPRLEPLREAFLGDFQQDTYFLLCAVGFVLLIACANVANLLLARGYARRKEFAIRASVGGGRGRLIRQMLTESLLISLLGGVIGLVLTVWGIKAYVLMAPAWFSRAADARIDGRVLAFTTVVSVLSGLLFGLLPALHVSKVDLAKMLNEGGQTAGLAARRWTRGFLLVAETALAVALLAGAGLMIASYAKAGNVDLGYDPRHVLTMFFRLNGKAYYDDLDGGLVRVTRKPETFYGELAERARSLPGVESAGIMSSFQDISARRFSIVGRALDKPTDRPFAIISEVDPGFFPTLNVRLLRGRFIDDGDTGGSAWVVVINETLARRFFPHENPVGQSLLLTMEAPGRAEGVDEDHPRLIVGVVKDLKRVGFNRDMPAVYTSYQQHAWLYPNGNVDPHLYKTLIVRTSLPPSTMARALRKAAAAVDPTQAPFDAVTVENLIADTLAYPRFMTQLVSLFAAFAVLLAAVGVYGTTHYLVGQRRHEMALRAALGARKSDLTWLVVKGAVALTVLGAVLGGLATFALSKILKRFLFGVESIDPKMLLAGALLMIAVAALAGYLPVRRAAKVDPMAALRHE
jgi:putative ABC transport system permease protein